MERSNNVASTATVLAVAFFAFQVAVPMSGIQVSFGLAVSMWVLFVASSILAVWTVRVGGGPLRPYVKIIASALIVLGTLAFAWAPLKVLYLKGPTTVVSDSPPPPPVAVTQAQAPPPIPAAQPARDMAAAPEAKQAKRPPAPARPPARPAPGVSQNMNNSPGGIQSLGDVTINNPLPPEQTWQLSVVACDEWVQKLNTFGATNISIGAFISNRDGNRVVKLLAACLQRSTWKPSMAVLPADPDGVVVGASANGPKVQAVEWGLRHIGLRVTAPDIRAEYGDGMDIVVGSNPIAPR